MKKIILTALFVSAFFSSAIFAGPSVLPVDGSSPYGQSYEKWAADFSQWVYSIPYNRNPMVAGNLNCTQPQHSSVWFIGSGTNTSKRPYKNSVVKCDVPEGKAIFMNAGAYIDTWPCPDPSFVPAPGQTLEEFLTLDAQSIVDKARTIPNGFSIDGQLMLSEKEALNQRVTSGLFTLTGDPSLYPNFDSCVTGKPQKAVADGYWAMIVGLPAGPHKFSFTDGLVMNVNVVHQ